MCRRNLARAAAGAAAVLLVIGTGLAQSLIVPLSGGATIATPPAYYVRAWAGTDDRVHTMESTDGVAWVRARTMPAPGPSGGAAATFDGINTWMVMWNAAGAVGFVTGVGGPETPADGITWFAGSSTIVPTAATVSGTPTVAFGNGKFLAVFRDSSGMLRAIPSTYPRPATTTDVSLGFTGNDPHLTYGKGRFVLAYIANSNLVARTSVDGLCWSAPRTIFSLTHLTQPEGTITPSGASLSFANGSFYAVGKLVRRFPPSDSDIIGTRLAVFESLDGASWRTLTDFGPAVFNDTGIPGAQFAHCQLAIAHDERLTVGGQIATPNLCTDPAALTFSTVPSASAPAAAPGRKMAVAFSHASGPFLESKPALNAPNVISFGSVPVGDIAQRTLTLSNPSAVPVTVTLAASQLGVFRWNGFDGSLQCGANGQVHVNFLPVSEGEASATLSFTSNAQAASHTVKLSGKGTRAQQPL